MRTLVAIPAFNEEVAIGSVVLRSLPLADCVLVVDDGSADSTAAIAEAAGAKILRHGKNKGKAAGVKTAFSFALEENYDAVILIDGDMQHDPLEIPRLLEPLEKDEADISLGFRFGEKTEMPAWRKAGKRVLDYATAMSSGGRVTDSQCGYRAFNRKAVEFLLPKISGDGFSVESEMLMKAGNSLRFSEVQISCKYDGVDGSTKGPFEHAMGVLDHIMWFTLERHPLLFVGVPSFLCMVTAVFMAIFTLQRYNISGVFSIPFALVTAVFAIIGAIGAVLAMMIKVMTRVIRRSA
ncbi:MAG: glycosyltransferase family 2 protein [Thermoplasmata archaeon HGW-Thermoplasmata-1]|nr:MAG: glycosyltransferase family 2 protein [Thermoplasmata archaeon HGW-Thermoplasmata-1]